MSWLDALLDRGREAKTQAPVAKPRAVRLPERTAPEIKQVWVQTAAPRDGDAGGCEPGFYSVADGVLTMHDESGKPTGQRQQLGPGDDPHRIAGRLTRAAWISAIGEGNFNRRIDYQPSGIA
jgi:hypothetical protein